MLRNVDKTNDLETRVKSLESRVKALQALVDIEEIKRLQRAYGYYLEHWMAEEVIDCFADSPGVVLALYEGTWLGKDGVRKYFGRREDVSPEFIHQVMQLSPIIDVEANGEIAKGRWYSWGVVAAPAGNGVRQFFMGGIYECVYIKEGGKWKILRLEYSMQIAADPTEGWVSPERVAKPDPSARRRFEGPQPDIPPQGMDSRYPSGYIFPFHYRHPVTGKETSEAKRNAKLKFVPNRFIQEREEQKG